MSISNENSPHVVAVYLGGITSALVVPALHLPKKSYIKSIKLMNGADIGADNSNYITLTIKKGSTSVATLDSRAANQGAVTANVAKAFGIVSGQETQDALSDLTLTYAETGTEALLNAQLMIEYYPL